MAAHSADVCYRHPQRESWTLCTRCGRTICPECQILTPAGVQCPDCVKETGGSVKWQSAGGEIKRPVSKTRKTRPTRPSPSAAAGSSFGATLGQMFRPGGEVPVLTWGTIALAVVLWVAGLISGQLPVAFLAAIPGLELQVWRFFTSPVVYPGGAFISLLLSGLFFALTAPAVERNLGRRRFLATLLASAGIGSAAMLLSGNAAYGLTGVLFGMFGAYLIFVWSYPPARVQALIIIGINLLINIAFGGFSLPQIIGGLIAGAGATYLFQRADDNRFGQRTPYLILAGVTAVLIVFAIIRGLF